MMLCLATSRGEDVKSQPQKTCFRAPRGALERWFGGPTRSPTRPQVSLVHGRSQHHLNQHNYEPFACSTSRWSTTRGSAWSIQGGPWERRGHTFCIKKSFTAWHPGVNPKNSSDLDVWGTFPERSPAGPPPLRIYRVLAVSPPCGGR